MVRVSVDVSSPGFVEKLITQDIGIVSKPLSHLYPELCKVILNLLFVVIETLPVIWMKWLKQLLQLKHAIILYRRGGGVMLDF